MVQKMPSLDFSNRTLFRAKSCNETRPSPSRAEASGLSPRTPRPRSRCGSSEEALVRRASPPDNPVHAEITRLERELAGACGELVGVREALGEARARADAAETRSVELSADLAAERARTEKAFAAFSALADRLDVLTAAPPRPWWRRLTG